MIELSTLSDGEKILALIDFGFAEDHDDARAQLIDMGEIDDDDDE